MTRPDVVARHPPNSTSRIQGLSTQLASVVTPLRAFVCAIVIGGIWQWSLEPRAVPLFEEMGFASLRRGITSGMWSMWSGGWFFPLLRMTYNVFFGLVGFHTFVPFRAFALVCNLALVLSLFAYCRARRVPWFGTLIGSYVILFGAASGRTALVPLLAIFPLAIAGLPVALLLLERNTPRSDIAAAGVLLLAMGFNGPVALPICCGIGLWLLQQRPIRWWRLLVPALPCCVYVLALITATAAPSARPPGYPTGIGFPLRPGDVISFFSRMATSLFAAMVGVGAPAGGRPEAQVLGLLLLTSCLALVAVCWKQLERAARERIIVSAVVLVLLWMATSVARAESYGLEAAAAPRYLIFGAVPVLIVLSELVVVIRGPARAILPLFIGVAACVNAVLFVHMADSLQVTFDVQRARGTALELAGVNAAAHYYPATGPGAIEFWVDALGYRELKARFGSFATKATDLRSAPVVTRKEVDRVMLDIPMMTINRVHSRRVSCVSVRGGVRTFVVSETGLVVANIGNRAEALLFRRFGEEYQAAPRFVAVEPAGIVRIQPKKDRSSVPWLLAVQGPAEVCAG